MAIVATVTAAALFALLSATSNAMSAAMQHHAASSAPDGTGVAALIRYLLRRKEWIAAILLGPVGFSLHLLALHFGPITLVQPIVILGIVLAVPFRAAWARTWPRPKELGAVALAAASIALLLVALSPDEAHRGYDADVLLVAVLACLGGAAVIIAASTTQRRPVPRAFLLGVGAGVAFGLMAVLMKAVTQHADAHGVVSVFTTTWLPYLTCVCGLSGVVVNQLAFRAARISASMPVLNVVNCLLTIVFGYSILHEQLDLDPLSLTLAGVAVVMMVAGLRALAVLEDEAERQPDLEPTA